MCKSWKRSKGMILTGMVCVSLGLCGCGGAEKESPSDEDQVKIGSSLGKENHASAGVYEGEDYEADYDDEYEDEYEEDYEVDCEEYDDIAVDEGVEEVPLSGEDQYKVNIFLSNFAETRMGHFNSDDCCDYDLISFAFNHAKCNNMDAVRYVDMNMGISLKDVNKILERYMGMEIQPEENVLYSEPGNNYGFEYKDGYFWMPAADGESYGIIAVADSMFKLEEGIYEVVFDVYSIPELNTGGNEVDDKQYYYLSAEDAVDSSELEYITTGSAVVEPYKKGKIDSYHLLNYGVSN